MSHRARPAARTDLFPASPILKLPPTLKVMLTWATSRTIAVTVVIVVRIVEDVPALCIQARDLFANLFVSFGSEGDKIGFLVHP